MTPDFPRHEWVTDAALARARAKLGIVTVRSHRPAAYRSIPETPRRVPVCVEVAHARELEEVRHLRVAALAVQEWAPHVGLKLAPIWAPPGWLIGGVVAVVLFLAAVGAGEVGRGCGRPAPATAVIGGAP